MPTTPADETINCLRFLFLNALVLAACSVSFLVYRYLRDDENNFEERFLLEAARLVDALEMQRAQMVGTIDCLANDIESYANSTASDWPYVTIPDWEQRVQRVQGVAPVLHIAWQPIVDNDTAWKEYTVSKQETECNTHSLSSQEPIAPHANLSSSWWQAYPPIPQSWELLQSNNNNPKVFQQLTFAIPESLENQSGWWRDSIGMEAKEPLASILYPLMHQEQVVGTLVTTFAWRRLLQQVAPTTGPIQHVTLSSPCAPTSGGHWMIQKGQVTLTDPSNIPPLPYSYNHMLTTKDHWASRPIDNDYCPFTIQVSRCQSQVNPVDNQLALWASLVAFAFCAATSLVFVIYDRCVEKRQRFVVLEALQSSTLEALLEEKVQERKQSLQERNAQLEAANQHISRASEAQLQHFACMSHEIRTPLNCIMGCSSLLNSTPLDEAQHDSVHMISSSGELLLNVVNDVLEYSRLETGNVEIEQKETALQPVLDAAWDSHDSARITTTYSPNVPEYLRTDARRFQEVLQKVLQHCLQHGETVDVLVHVDELDQQLVLRIRDHGPGTDDCETIHQPFGQDGTANGLGIAICFKLVAHMGGTIKVTSEVGIGTEFAICFPVQVQPNESLEQALEKLRKSRVIVVTHFTEKRRYLQSIADHYNIPMDCVCNQAQATALDQSMAGNSRILVVQSSMYDAPLWKACPKRVVLTFGPDKEHSDIHWQISILRKLPTTLIKSFCSHLERSQSKPTKKDWKKLISGLDIEVPYPSLRLLIAEDNVVNQKVLARLLKRLGAVHVSIVSNGQQAVDLEAKQPFDFIFMDMQMPVMDGLEATRCIQQREGDHECAKIIFITAHALLDFQDQCFEAGGIEFVAKPCSIGSIDQCLKRIYQKDRSLLCSDNSSRSILDADL